MTNTATPAAPSGEQNLDHLEALAPCPFCGNEAQISGNGQSNFGYCPECETEGPPDATPAAARDTWNRRAAPVSAPIAGDAALRAALDMLLSDHDVGKVLTAWQWEQCESALANQPAPTAALEQDENIEADAYMHACDEMERWQKKRAKAGLEIGTAGSLIDGISWLYAHIEKLESQPSEAAPLAWMLDFGDGERVVTADPKEFEAWVTQHDNPYTPIPLYRQPAQAAQHEAAQSNDRQMTVKQTADGWPGEIYLQAGDEPLSHFSEYDEVSWCDHPQGESDVRYVRADELAASPVVRAQSEESEVNAVSVAKTLMAGCKSGLMVAARICDETLWELREAGVEGADLCGACAESIRDLARVLGDDAQQEKALSKKVNREKIKN